MINNTYKYRDMPVCVSNLYTKNDAMQIIYESQRNGPSFHILSDIQNEYYEVLEGELIIDLPISNELPTGGAIIPVQEGFLLLPYKSYDCKMGVLYDVDRAYILRHTVALHILDRYRSQTVKTWDYLTEMFDVFHSCGIPYKDDAEKETDYLARPLNRACGVIISPFVVQIYTELDTVAHCSIFQEIHLEDIEKKAERIKKLAVEKGYKFRETYYPKLHEDWPVFEQQQKEVLALVPEITKLAESVNQRGIHIGYDDDTVLRKLVELTRTYDEKMLQFHEYRHIVQYQSNLSAYENNMERGHMKNIEVII